MSTGGYLWILAALLAAGTCPARAQQTREITEFELHDGGIIRGPTDRKQLALVFAGHTFAEGAETILQGLARHHAKASFFLTGVLLTNRDFAPLVRRIVQEGHYLGPHSDQHLLYCSWEREPKTLVSREEFQRDLLNNVEKIRATGLQPRHFLPAFEHYNRQIVGWTRECGLTLVNFTPGTRSTADYTGEEDANFVSSQAIYDSIIKREQQDPHGLNGYLLLLHAGAGPGRTDKFHTRFGELLEYLAGKGYQFMRIDDLLATPATKFSNANSLQKP